MRKLTVAAAILISLLALSMQAAAQGTDSTKAQQGMPPMGPPEEMKQVAYLVGTWDFTMKFKMNPTDTSWTDSKGTAKYAYVYGGAAIMSTIEEQMMGMPFTGGTLMCYDRETKKWQTSWIDNMAARLTIYTGIHTATGSVFQGEDMMMGKSYLSRMTTSNHTPTSFDWKGEMSEDAGKTWMTWGTAKYAKRK